jgi:hypothetical protein
MKAQNYIQAPEERVQSIPCETDNVYTGKIKVDIHNHLSTFAKLKDFNKTINLIKERLGPGGICGLVNFGAEGDMRYEDFIELEPKGYHRDFLDNAIYLPEKDVWVVKCQEVWTDVGHLLVAGVNHGVAIPSHMSLENSLKAADSEKGVKLLVHMYGWQGMGDYILKHPELLEQFDAMETYNGEANLWLPFVNHLNANKKAKKFYDSVKERFPNLGTFVSSDGHDIEEMGRNYTMIPDFGKGESKFKDADSIRQGLIDGFRAERGLEDEKKSLIIPCAGAVNHILNLVRSEGIKKIRETF